MIDRNAETSKVTIHQLTTEPDAGPVLGQSSPVNVKFADGSMTDNILVLDDKMLQPVDVMGALLKNSRYHQRMLIPGFNVCDFYRRNRIIKTR